MTIRAKEGHQYCSNRDCFQNCTSTVNCYQNCKGRCPQHCTTGESCVQSCGIDGNCRQSCNSKKCLQRCIEGESCNMTCKASVQCKQVNAIYRKSSEIVGPTFSKYSRRMSAGSCFHQFESRSSSESELNFFTNLLHILLPGPLWTTALQLKWATLAK